MTRAWRFRVAILLATTADAASAWATSPTSPRTGPDRAGHGLLAEEFGATRLVSQQFNAGPEEVTALLGGSLDAGLIGSSPAINAFAESKGEAATLQASNTQDVALKKWLKEHNLPIGSGTAGRDLAVGP